MNNYRKLLSHAVQALWVTSAVIASAPTLAAAASATVERQADAKPSRAGCPYGTATAASTRCLTKADVGVAGSKAAAPDRDPAQYLRNALLRCDRLSGDDRQDCVSRIKGAGTTSGSVAGGGISRELITREPVLPKTTASEGAAPIDAPK